MHVGKELKIKIYLKSRRAPFIAIVDNEQQVNNLISLIETQHVVKFGMIAFASEEFRYLVVC